MGMLIVNVSGGYRGPLLAKQGEGAEGKGGEGEGQLIGTPPRRRHKHSHLGDKCYNKQTPMAHPNGNPYVFSCRCGGHFS